MSKVAFCNMENTRSNKKMSTIVGKNSFKMFYRTYTALCIGKKWIINKHNMKKIGCVVSRVNETNTTDRGEKKTNKAVLQETNGKD